MKQRDLKKIVITESSAKEFLPDVKVNDVEFAVADDVLEFFFRYVQPVSVDDNLILVLFLAACPSIDRIHDLLKYQPIDRIQYRCIAFGRDNDYTGGINAVDFRTTPFSSAEAEFKIVNVFQNLLQDYQSSRELDVSMYRLQDTKNDQDALINIGKALSMIKDKDKLLRRILYFSKKITGADAGSIFLAAEDGNGEKKLRFSYSHTFSNNVEYEEFFLPLDISSIAGYVAVTGHCLNIPDVYKLGSDDPVSFNNSFDIKTGYITRSMLIVPMRNRTDEVIGVIQLINSKESMEEMDYSGNEAFEIMLSEKADFDRYVVPFEERYESLMEAVASQAAVALENNRMIVQIQTQFEEFVKASVTAIDSRDPSTAGHSSRVSKLCTVLARAVNETAEGPYGSVRFSDQQVKELELAGLLHDFGKVYIDPQILLKANKLYPYQLNEFLTRVAFFKRSLENSINEELLAVVVRDPGDSVKDLWHNYSQKKISLLADVDGMIERILQINNPELFIENINQELDEINKYACQLGLHDYTGEPLVLITSEEIENLTTRFGSLNPKERKLIEDHVMHTESFVSRIPWPSELDMIPEITAKHHEKLDGSGYPRGITADQIPPQARIMTIVDIYDALAAPDRPYKKAVPRERIFQILAEEVQRGKLDADLLEIFLKCEAWKATLGEEQKKPV